MDVEDFRHFLPRQRPHRALAFLEEILLQGNDDARHAADGVGAFVDGGQEPAGFLQLRLQEGFVRAFCRFRQRGVGLVDGEVGMDVIGGFDVADAVFFAHDDVRLDVLHSAGVVFLSGAGIKAAQERHGVIVGGNVHVQTLPNHLRAARDEAVVALHDELQRVQVGGMRRQGGELQVQAFFKIARTDPARLALLHDADALFDVGHAELLLGGDGFRLAAEVAVVIQFEGNGKCRAAPCVIQRHLVDLFFEVGGQGRLGAEVEFGVVVFFAVGRVVFPVVVVVFFPGAVVFEFAAQVLQQAVCVFAAITAVAFASRIFVEDVALALQHDVLRQHVADFDVQIQVAHVEQFDCLL